MNIKLAAVNALKFVKKFGMTCGAAGTKGLVRLADGTVEEQVISWSRRGKVITARRVVGKDEMVGHAPIGDEMAGFMLITYLEDHYEPKLVMLKSRERILGQPEVYFVPEAMDADEANQRYGERYGMDWAFRS
jgi:hypothetical protein